MKKKSLYTKFSFLIKCNMNYFFQIYLNIIYILTIIREEDKGNLSNLNGYWILLYNA